MQLWNCVTSRLTFTGLMSTNTRPRKIDLKLLPDAEQFGGWHSVGPCLLLPYWPEVQQPPHGCLMQPVKNVKFSLGLFFCKIFEYPITLKSVNWLNQLPLIWPLDIFYHVDFLVLFNLIIPPLISPLTL